MVKSQSEIIEAGKGRGLLEHKVKKTEGWHILIV